MKKYAFLTLILVLTTVLLMGCGCTNQNKKPTMPTTLPTETTRATTAPTTQATTQPNTHSTENTQPTVDRGNGPLEDQSTNAATSDQAEARSRSNMNGMR